MGSNRYYFSHDRQRVVVITNNDETNPIFQDQSLVNEWTGYVLFTLFLFVCV
jgi:acyl carrier protein phosphodiesterase